MIEIESHQHSRRRRVWNNGKLLGVALRERRPGSGFLMQWTLSIDKETIRAISVHDLRTKLQDRFGYERSSERNKGRFAGNNARR